jgi:hypothetical protein
LNLSLEPSARPPETMIFAAVSSGRSFFAISLPTKVDLPESATLVSLSMAAEPPVAAAGSKPVVRTVITLIAVQALHRRDRVAGVDRALEGVGVDLGDVEIWPTSSLAADPRRERSCRGGGREQDVAVVLRDRQHLRGDVLGQAVFEVAASACSTLRHAGDLRAGLARRRRRLSRRSAHARRRRTCKRGGHGVQRGAP